MVISERMRGSANDRRIVIVAGAVLLALVMFLLFRQYYLPWGAAVRGVVLGMLTALLAIGLALVYRANRVLNFAQADLGAVPTSFAVALVVFSGWPLLLGFSVGLAIS